jgi:hypothetical protein
MSQDAFYISPRNPESGLGPLRCSVVGNAETSIDHVSNAPPKQATDEVVLNTRSMSRDFGLLQRKSRTDTPSESDSGTGLTDWSGQRSTEMASMVDYAASDDGGQFHYYGYTSNLQVLSQFPLTSRSQELERPWELGEPSLEKLADSDSTISDLLELYFTYQHSALPILDSETFMTGYRRRQKSSYFSPFLLYSILLRAIRLSDNPRVRSLDSIYLPRAKAELLPELDNPTIATIQALCLFGQYLGSSGNERACWLYPGERTQTRCPSH